MVKQFGQYTRIFLSRMPFANQGLWEAEDHVMLATKSGWTESYKRFYFKDIQAVLTVRNRRQVFWSLVLGIACVILLLTGISSGLNGGGWASGPAIVLLAAGLVSGAIAFINALRGPTCSFYIRTAVQQERIPTIARVSTARRIETVLKRAAEQAQGVLTPEAAETLWIQTAMTPAKREEPTRRPPTPPRRRHARKEALAEGLRPYQRKTHTIMFCLLLVEAVRVVFTLEYHHVNTEPIALLLMVAIFATNLVALAHQGSTDLAGRIKGLTYVTLVYSAVMTLILVVRFKMGLMDLDGIVTRWSRPHPLESPGSATLTILDMIGSLGLGVLGVVWMSIFRRRSVGAAEKPVSPPPPAQAPPAQAPPAQADRNAPDPVGVPPAATEMTPPPEGAPLQPADRAEERLTDES